jgi:guanylate kinase
MKRKGRLIVISGPSGVGKGTVVKTLMDRDPRVRLSVSATTREPRPDEVDGVHYRFISREEFTRMAQAGEFLEWAEYGGNLYGTPKAPVEELLAAGKNVLLEIEVQGAEKVMKAVPDTVSVFITIPSMEELERRLRGRKTESEDKILARLAIAERELRHAYLYDYVVLNDEIEFAVARIEAIMKAESVRYDRMKDTVLEVLQDVETNRH